MTLRELNNKLQVGDLVFVHSKGFLPAAIRFFMKIYAKKFCDNIPSWVANHMGIIGLYDGEFRVGESTEKGYPFTKINEAYSQADWGTKVRIYRAKRALSEAEKCTINDYIKDLSFAQTKYEFKNFLWWPVWILSNKKWYIGAGKKTKLNSMYCFESASRAFNSGRPVIPNPQRITSIEVLQSGLFERVL